jgi:hypothetical protein
MDLFDFYRALLAIFLTVYTLLMTAAMIVQGMWLLTSRDRTAAILRKYLVLLALRMRVRAFRNELIQIALLSVAFIALLYGHLLPLPTQWPLAERLFGSSGFRVPGSEKP